ncbi:MAG: hypothetical protein H0T94_00910 [Acidimicrobiia bacterium]|nr:hypothetical protein [Acidimicrobiia bacterium]
MIARSVTDGSAFLREKAVAEVGTGCGCSNPAGTTTFVGVTKSVQERLNANGFQAPGFSLVV